MITLDQVSFSYRSGEHDEVQALSAVTAHVQPSEFVAIVGHNGSGKSTLLKLLAALLYATSGQISVDGIVVSHATRWDVRRRVAVVFQNPDDQLVANRVLDDVAFGPENLGLPRPELADRVQLALRSLDLEPHQNDLIDDLSRGLKQQVAIAGALAMRPQFLVLDEPTSLLPAPLAHRLIATLRRLNRDLDMGVLYITHAMSEAALFDRLLVLDDGRLLMDGKPSDVFERVEELRDAGLDVPVAASVARILRDHGVPMPASVLTDDDLLASLAPRVGVGMGHGARH